MAKAPDKFRLVPQRYQLGRGWVDCAEQTATSWLVTKAQGSSTPLRYGRFAVKQQAVDALQKAQRLSAPRRKFGLGAACPPRLAATELLAQSSKPRSS